MNRRRLIEGIVLAVVITALLVWLSTRAFYTYTPKPPKEAPVPTVVATACAPCYCCPCPSCPKPEVKPAVKKKPAHKAAKLAPVAPAIVRLPPPVAPALPPVPPSPTTTAINQLCPNGWTLIANAWSLQTLPEELRTKTEGLITVAGSRNTYRGDDVSRTIGGVLRKDVKVRATTNADIRVLYRDPKTLAVVKDLGILKVSSGVGSFSFPDDPRSYIVETIWPATFVSPTVSMGERRLWIFPDEWRRFCSPNVHGIVP